MGSEQYSVLTEGGGG